ncbi:adenylosuccinate lyase [Opitutus terrae]|uniref:Adenylosuccinate lyase n=1 Tax=Opitutus terrae (strain DSM 11246 / JCM 15787 / PB90-1) TaxID=452637 RepID=B1ZS11_OPITP|nr:adenylosuccinate lyase [Opitutus terrae]ACB74687.1 adenylosuccinate lyase [Opitutus terrae PB90-1]
MNDTPTPFPTAAPIPNVLAERYASVAMKDIWSQTGRIALERDFWIAVMKAQRDLGVPIPADAIKDYERVKGQIDLASIDKRERVTLHDVKARIEEFSDLAKRQFIHLGLTSRDLTENVEQLQIFRALKTVRFKTAAALLALGRQAEAHRDLMITGRTHNVPAQPTTLGKRLAMFGQELLIAFTRLEELLERYPVRGLKGAVGTQLDQLTLLGGDSGKVDQLEARVLRHLGFRASLFAVGQVYPRSLDFEVVSALHQVGAAAASCATTVRLMAGAGLVTEGFQEGQVGSSSMPHKVNARNCERICGFSTILGGFVTMTSGLSGHQWNEGDVSCSVVRRLALPDSFFAIDGLLETFITVLRQMEVFPAAIAAENERNLPFLATTTILMEAVKRGGGRETAHAAIKEHTLAAAKALRSGGGDADLLSRLAGDKRIGLNKRALQTILGESARFVGAAPHQVDAFLDDVKPLAKKHKGATDYRPARLL